MKLKARSGNYGVYLAGKMKYLIIQLDTGEVMGEKSNLSQAFRVAIDLSKNN